MEGEFRGGTGASEGRHGLVSSLPGLLQSHSQRVGVGVGKHPATPLGAESEKHGGREDCWSEAATFTLIEAWGNHYLELNRGNLKQKHWKEVAEAVNAREEGKVGKTDVQCKNRLDTLKKKYKLEKNKLAEAGGNGSSKWPFFHKLDELIGTFRKHKKCALLPADKHAKSWGSPSGQHQRRGGAALKEGEDKVVVAYQNAASASTKSKESPDMTDSCPHALEDDDVGTGGGGAANGGATRGTHAGEGTSDRATEAKSFKKRKLQDEPFKDLARAIIKFAEVYERIESAKQRQLSELEKQRMEFTKDLELKRMQLFMQTQNTMLQTTLCGLYLNIPEEFVMH